MIFATVLKSGGDFSPEHVQKIAGGLRRAQGQNIEIVCLTDTPRAVREAGATPVRLLHDWPGWWSKLELFRPELFSGPVLYLDLDTIILRDIDRLVDLAVEGRDRPLLLRGISPKEREGGWPISGIMSWHGEQLWEAYYRFKKNPQGIIQAFKDEPPGQNGDQGFLRQRVIGTDYCPIQGELPPEYIAFKKDWKRQGSTICKKAHLIAWSGQPRLGSSSAPGSINALWEEQGK